MPKTPASTEISTTHPASTTRGKSSPPKRRTPAPALLLRVAELFPTLRSAMPTNVAITLPLITPDPPSAFNYGHDHALYNTSSSFGVHLQLPTLRLIKDADKTTSVLATLFTFAHTRSRSLLFTLLLLTPAYPSRTTVHKSISFQFFRKNFLLQPMLPYRQPPIQPPCFADYQP